MGTGSRCRIVWKGGSRYSLDVVLFRTLWGTTQGTLSVPYSHHWIKPQCKKNQKKNTDTSIHFLPLRPQMGSQGGGGVLEPIPADIGWMQGTPWTIASSSQNIQIGSKSISQVLWAPFVIWLSVCVFMILRQQAQFGIQIQKLSIPVNDDSSYSCAASCFLTDLSYSEKHLLNVASLDLTDMNNPWIIFIITQLV